MPFSAQNVSKICILFLGIKLCVFSVMLPFPSPLPAVDTSYDLILKKTWDGIKKRMIDPYDIKLVHRPRSEEPDDAVSEGVGYGMLCALYCNDQTYFNKIWDAGEQHMWDENGNCYNWRISKDGGVIGQGAASDADQDIAVALIFADGLVKKNTWSSHTSPKGVDYATRAQSIIKNIWNTMVEDGRYLRPGTLWGGRGFLNPGYFAPAFYRVFDEFESENHNWSGVIDQCYQSIEASPGYENGLVPDWMQPDGNYAGADQLGYNAYAGGQFMYKDAIRVLWRLATDYIWYNEPRAKKYCDNAYTFIITPDRANFFQMDGSTVNENFTLGNGVERPRTEHSSLTIGMWATAVMASGGPEAAEPFSDELLKFYEGGDYWGRSSDPNNEDTLHNEMYFEQFLSWFGASLLAGVFTNLWDDFKDSTPEIAPDFKETPQITPFDIDANKKPLSIKAVFNKTVRWNVNIIHRDDSSSAVEFGGSGTIVDLQWNGSFHNGKYMRQGAYYVTISGRGIKKPFSQVVWLGRALDLKSDSRLIADNFMDGDLRPYIGSSWGSYTEQSDGKTGNTTIKRLDVATNEEPSALHWAFRLEGSSTLGFNAYAALEWNCISKDTNFTLSGLDTILFNARAASELKVSVQIITSDITDFSYFEDSVTLSNEMTEYILPVTEFRQRLNGSGHQLDLSKCTAIRFQVQDVDGTENEIVMEKMLFAGSIASGYSSPPVYIKPEPDLRVTEKNKINDAMSGNRFRTVRFRKSVSFEFPFVANDASLEIISISGTCIKKIEMLQTSRIAWRFTDSRDRPVASGCYIAVVKAAGQSYRVPLYHLP